MSLASPSGSKASSWRTILDQCQVEAQIIIDASGDESLKARAHVAKQHLDDLHQQLNSFDDDDLVDTSTFRLQSGDHDWMPVQLRQLFDGPDPFLPTFGPVRTASRSKGQSQEGSSKAPSTVSKQRKTSRSRSATSSHAKRVTEQSAVHHAIGWYGIASYSRA